MSSDVRTSNVAKYAIGQHVQGLNGGTVSGFVIAIRADTPGSSAGPGVITVGPSPPPQQQNKKQEKQKKKRPKR